MIAGITYQRERWRGNVIDRFNEPLAEVKWADGLYEEKYNELNEFVVDNSHKKNVLEIGCHLGRWTRNLIVANSIIGVDLYDESGDYIKKEFSHLNFEFYRTEGDELNGIKDESVDFVFSIDSLTRASLEVIKSYLSEIFRVLKKDGTCALHIPSKYSHLSNRLDFPKIDTNFVIHYCRELGYENTSLCNTYIQHGVLLKLKK